MESPNPMDVPTTAFTSCSAKNTMSPRPTPRGRGSRCPWGLPPDFRGDFQGLVFVMCLEHALGIGIQSCLTVPQPRLRLGASGAP